MKHRCPAAIPKGRWRDLWTSCLEGLGDPSRADARLLDRMVLNLMSAEAALKTALRKPYVLGSTGQQVEHPAFKVAARCDTQTLAIARQLRLTPLARSSGTANQGKAKAEEDPFDALEQADELARARNRRGSAS